MKRSLLLFVLAYFLGVGNLRAEETPSNIPNLQELCEKFEGYWVSLDGYSFKKDSKGNLVPRTYPYINKSGEDEYCYYGKWDFKVKRDRITDEISYVVVGEVGFYDKLIGFVCSPKDPKITASLFIRDIKGPKKPAPFDITFRVDKTKPVSGKWWGKRGKGKSFTAITTDTEAAVALLKATYNMEKEIYIRISGNDFIFNSPEYAKPAIDAFRKVCPF